ncbi:MAG: C40 family peptidase [Gemmatimonadaceae bacterium]
MAPPLTRRVLSGLLLCALVATTGEIGAQPLARPNPAPTLPTTGLNTAPLAGFSESASTLRDSIVAIAKAQLGTRYVFGGTNPERGFDCSGLIRYLARALKLDVPRTAAQQATVGRPVATERKLLRPGDLLTFGSAKRPSHIGIYIGDGKYIHASTGAGKVIVADLDRRRFPGMKPWTGVRRLIAGDDSGSTATGGG